MFKGGRRSLVRAPSGRFCNLPIFVSQSFGVENDSLRCISRRQNDKVGIAHSIQQDGSSSPVKRKLYNAAASCALSYRSTSHSSQKRTSVHRPFYCCRYELRKLDDGNEQLYSAMHSERPGSKNVLNVWAFNGGERIPPEDIQTGYFDTRLVWLGENNKVSGVFCATATPESYGAAMYLRIAECGPDMPLQGIRQCGLGGPDKTPSDRFFQFSQPPLALGNFSINAPELLKEHTDALLFGSVFNNNTGIFREHSECEAYIRADTISSLITLHSLKFFPNARIISTMSSTLDTPPVDMGSTFTTLNRSEVALKLYGNMNCREATHVSPRFSPFYDYREHPRFAWWYRFTGRLLMKWVNSDLRVWLYDLRHPNYGPQDVIVHVPETCAWCNNATSIKSVDDGSNDVVISVER
jgi:hypothetical protein